MTIIRQEGGCREEMYQNNKTDCKATSTIRHGLNPTQVSSQAGPDTGDKENAKFLTNARAS